MNRPTGRTNYQNRNASVAMAEYWNGVLLRETLEAMGSVVSHLSTMGTTIVKGDLR